MLLKRMAVHGIHSMPCSNTNDIRDLLPKQLRGYVDVQLTSVRRPAKVLSTTVGNSIVLMVANL